MSSSNALAAGGGGVGWQVDLPGLASLVLNLGASGLKRFAEAGVDFHTILCMGEIAEKCAASNEYRRELAACRQAQRKQAQWLYKMVEIGAATNFVADELLKKRAGENVVALMSAILPVMSEACCDNLLLKLFEACNTPLDKTPGFGQLRAIRETLTPLARKTQFKDRAYQYHVFSRQLLDADAGNANTPAYESIPSEETAVKVILALSKLVHEDPGMILAYHGLRGSGWVIAYARHVLGLPVCVLRSCSMPVPISGDYQSARVLVYLYGGENKCEILLNRNVQDFFVTKSLELSGHAGWLIDVRVTNVLDIYISSTDPLRKCASIIARSMADRYVHMLAKHLYPVRSRDSKDQDSANGGLTRYPEFCLPALRKRAMSVLSRLGFEQIEGSNSQSSEWSEYIKIRSGDHLEFYLCPGHAWISSGLGHINVSDPGQKVEDLPEADRTYSSASSTERSRNPSPASVAHQGLELNEMGVKHMSFLFRAVEAACWLAFTDWDQDVCLLSIAFFESTASWEKCLVYEAPLISVLTKGFQLAAIDQPITIGMTDLFATVSNICIGEQQTWTPKFSEDNVLAFQQRGIVYAHNAALHRILDLESCFVHLIPGAIIVNGERQDKIYSSSTVEEHAEIVVPSSGDTKQRYIPVDSFPNISFSTRLEMHSVGVVLQQNALVNDQICAIPSPLSTSNALAKLYVTKECNHQYYDAYENGSIHIMYNGHFVISDMKQGLFVAGAHEDMTDKLWLQAVDQNAPGQWLAYQSRLDHVHLTVLQRDCCIACTCNMIQEFIINRWLHKYGSKTVRIIHGRLAGENMK